MSIAKDRSQPLHKDVEVWESVNSDADDGDDQEEQLPRSRYIIRRDRRSQQHSFRFSAHRTKLDWGSLYGIDPQQVIDKCDVDVLDRIVEHLCYADLTSEDPTHLSAANFLKLFRLAQLTLEYLLFVQDTLTHDCRQLSKQKCRIGQHLLACRLKLKEQDSELKDVRKELKQIKRHVQTYEILAASNPFPASVAENTSSDAQASNWHPRMLDVLQEFKRLSNEKSEIRTQIGQMKDELEKLWKVQSDVQHEHTDETRRLKYEFGELTSLLEDLNSAKKEATTLRTTRESLEVQIKDLEEKNTKLQSDHQRSQNAITEKDQEIHQLKLESVELQRQNAMLRNDVELCKKEQSEYGPRFDELRQEIHEKKVENVQIQSEVDRLLFELESDRKVTGLQAEKVKECRELRVNLQKAEAREQELQVQLQNVVEEHIIQLNVLKQANTDLRKQIVQLRQRTHYISDHHFATDLELPLTTALGTENNQKNMLSPKAYSTPRETDWANREGTLMTGNSERWGRFVQRYPVVMPWNNALRSKRPHTEQSFKQLAPSKQMLLQAQIDNKMRILGIDASLARVEDTDYLEAMRRLNHELLNKKKILSEEKQREYADLKASLAEHLEHHCPLPDSTPRSIHVALNRNSIRTASPAWSFTRMFSPMTSAVKRETDFSPLTHNLKKGKSKEFESNISTPRSTSGELGQFPIDYSQPKTSATMSPMTERLRSLAARGHNEQTNKDRSQAEANLSTSQAISEVAFQPSVSHSAVLDISSKTEPASSQSVSLLSQQQNEYRQETQTTEPSQNIAANNDVSDTESDVYSLTFDTPQHQHPTDIPSATSLTLLSLQRRSLSCCTNV